MRKGRDEGESECIIIHRKAEAAVVSENNITWSLPAAEDFMTATVLPANS